MTKEHQLSFELPPESAEGVVTRVFMDLDDKGSLKKKLSVKAPSRKREWILYISSNPKEPLIITIENLG